MGKEMEFFIYLIERYARYKNKNTIEVMKQLEMLNLVDKIYNMYDRYHIEAIENAFKDIDDMILECKE